MFSALVPPFPSLFLRLPTHTHIVARVIVPSYQAHARVKTQRYCQHTYIHTDNEITVQYYSHLPPTQSGLLPSVPPTSGSFHSYTPIFPLTYLRAYLISGVSCHHIHAQVRSITHPHTYHTGTQTEHFLNIKDQPPPTKPTLQLQLPEQSTSSPVHKLIPTSKPLNWKLNWHQSHPHKPVPYPPTYKPHRYPDP